MLLAKFDLNQIINYEDEICLIKHSYMFWKPSDFRAT